MKEMRREQHEIELWCAERRSLKSTTLDLSTLADNWAQCKRRAEAGDSIGRKDWIELHPVIGIRRCKLRTVDE